MEGKVLSVFHDNVTSSPPGSVESRRVASVRFDRSVRGRREGGVVVESIGPGKRSPWAVECRPARALTKKPTSYQESQPLAMPHEDSSCHKPYWAPDPSIRRAENKEVAKVGCPRKPSENLQNGGKRRVHRRHRPLWTGLGGGRYTVARKHYGYTGAVQHTLSTRLKRKEKLAK
jgi:hypothetical protein